MGVTTMAEATEAAAGYELSITRVFDAPRELVWRAWTDPAMAKQWMGPRGFTTVEFEAPHAVGETWRLVMEGSRPGSEQKVVLRQHGTTLEMKPPELLRYTFAWDERASVGLGPSPYKENVVTIRLEERGTKTVVHFTQTPFATEGERDGHTSGWNSALDCLAEFVAKQQSGRVAEDSVTELHMKRFFAAPREVVFAAWTRPESIAQWWGPRGFTNRVEAWEARSGGPIRLDMIAPDGTVYPMSGKFMEFFPPYRFHFTSSALDADEKPLFENWNSVVFEEVEGGTNVVLDVHVMSTTDEGWQYLKGMREGWGMTLDKLGVFLGKQ
jgi:uncharacterized protein YndB with AHSA1/START domain